MPIVRLALGLTLFLLTVTPSAARLIFVDEAHDGVDGVTGLSGARGIAISSDGRHVYAVGALADSIAVFLRSASTGRLQFLQVLQDGIGGIDGLDRPIHVIVSPDGTSVYVGSGGEDAIAIFRRDPGSGLLTFITAELGVGAAQGAAGIGPIAISPDSQNVYAGSQSGVIISFNRNPADGTLAVNEVERNGVNGVVGMNGVDQIGISPDGGRLLAIGSLSFVTFARDAGGELMFLDQALPGLSDFFTTGNLAFHPNGVDLYAVADAAGGAFGVLAADPGIPGRYIVRQTAGGGFPPPLGEPRGIAVSPNGDFVFASSLSSGIAAFRRNGDGTFVFSEQTSETVKAVFSIAVSPDSPYLYAAGAVSNNIAIFRIAADQAPLEIPVLSPAAALALIGGLAILLVVKVRRRRNDAA